MVHRLFGTAQTVVSRRQQMTDKEKDDLIISRPQALSTIRKGTEFTATAAGWFIWALLCRPLFLAILWFLGVKIFYEHMIRLGGVSSLPHAGHVYFIVLLIFYIVTRGWSSYNGWKFRGKERRVRNPSISAGELEHFFKLSPQTIGKAQSWKNITIDFQSGDQLVLNETSGK